MSRLHIDWTRCEGRGSCVELLPEVLDQDPWGFPLAKDGRKEPEVPEQLAGYARRAVTYCPVLALKLRAGEPAGQ